MKANRTKSSSTFATVIAALATMLLTAGPALAYLDPASSTFILQTIVAAIFGGLYFIKLNWLRLKAFLTGGSVETEVTPEANLEDERVEK
jgi:hypothetical protein